MRYDGYTFAVNPFDSDSRVPVYHHINRTARGCKYYIITFSKIHYTRVYTAADDLYGHIKRIIILMILHIMRAQTFLSTSWPAANSITMCARVLYVYNIIITI